MEEFAEHSLWGLALGRTPQHRLLGEGCIGHSDLYPTAPAGQGGRWFAPQSRHNPTSSSPTAGAWLRWWGWRSPALYYVLTAWQILPVAAWLRRPLYPLKESCHKQNNKHKCPGEQVGPGYHSGTMEQSRKWFLSESARQGGSRSSANLLPVAKPAEQSP